MDSEEVLDTSVFEGVVDGVAGGGVAEMPRPQTAAVTNLLLFHCFYGNCAGVLLSYEAK